ncbi:alpha/beta hydrolase domain-containing protein [Dermatobacter hominis]|uniref:alpha/beta hydrolase domain-containing protein n=1 Tax=Dermatobacter hominis TaxID=2884263 RepID=UPI001D128DF9|nr:alpha/beta hydrolase domain-containing protein [Dermatobacter hominis]UDY37856.1 hypothetical protein LH044_10000 [Dermatobacter hominis]
MATFGKVLVALALVVAAGCAGDDGGGTAEPADGPTTTQRARPEGPAADLSTELTGGAGTNVASASPPDAVLDAAGYEQREYEAAGTATAYAPEGELGPDGRWTVRPDREADYRTRIIVRRPVDPADSSGVVVAEWLNVSGGLDADPDWQMLHEDITRNGDTWVGVSAQVIGIEGGPVRVTTPDSEAAGAGRGIKAIDPERYGDLVHPGDDFGYDIFTQVARGLAAGGEPLGGERPELLLAVGESQSAFAMVTYINAVQPLAQVFDGFLVHSRGGPGLPLVTSGQAADIASALGGAGTLLRTDLGVPVIDVQSETDVSGLFASAEVRQDDTDTFRLWEMAGTAHADTRLVGDRSDSLGCGSINAGPMHLITKAAYRWLVEWAAGGAAPPVAPRLELVAGAAEPTLARDADGIVRGGIRTPLVDVPVDVLSGAPGANPDVVCLLSGQTTPLPPEALSARYSDADDYTTRYEAAADDAVEAGFVLAEDRAALLDAARPDRVG